MLCHFPNHSLTARSHSTHATFPASVSSLGDNSTLPFLWSAGFQHGKCSRESPEIVMSVILQTWRKWNWVFLGDSLFSYFISDLGYLKFALGLFQSVSPFCHGTAKQDSPSHSPDSVGGHCSIWSPTADWPFGQKQLFFLEKHSDQTASVLQGTELIGNRDSVRDKPHCLALGGDPSTLSVGIPESLILSRTSHPPHTPRVPCTASRRMGRTCIFVLSHHHNLTKRRVWAVRGGIRGKQGTVMWRDASGHILQRSSSVMPSFPQHSPTPGAGRNATLTLVKWGKKQG